MIERHVADFMSEPPETLPPDAPAVRAARRLRERRIGSVVVTADGTPAGELSGVVTESDLVELLADRGDGDTPVRRRMSTPPVTVRPGTPVDEVGEVVAEHGVRHLPVVADGTVVGVVTTKDVACLLPRYRLEPDSADG